ncbi:MAG: cell division protein FtsQ/DivIB [Rickettsiales bacterium]|nr:cell division protein FtsQ/DivIB [Rickettsiales bacterium]
MKKQIKNFFLTNHFLRKVRNFFRLTIFPTVIKASLILAALLFLIFAFLKIFKPAQLEKIYKKSSFYFLHYLNLDNQEFGDINISGNIHVEKEQILEIVQRAQKEIIKNDSDDYQPLTRKIIEQIKAELPWVHQVTIARSMPNSLNILIAEYVPIAIWQNEGEKYFTDKEGNLIPFEDLEEFKHMVILSGIGANIHAKSLFNIFTADENLSANVYSATWVSNRRWDIRFENGLLIKLPENNISDAWRRLIKIYNMPGSIVGLKVIDLRVLDKVYLEYDDSVIKELKSL